ncbi:major facilitator superfamily domain-containing protein [Mycena rebaudengoi]|nr:major facilitator superfamily domain-containing protein [Mycena rebaudengoi]
MADPEKQKETTETSASDERHSPPNNGKEESSAAESKPTAGPPPFPEGTSSSTISWIGSVQTFWSVLSSLGASISWPLLVIGGVDFALSCMLQSISTHYWHFLLSQGFLGGITLSCLFTPAYTAAQHWFLKRRGFALGVVTSGSSVGGVIWPIVANRLIQRVGFGWALRTMGFISLALCLMSAVLVKGRLPARKGKQFFAFDLFLKPGYTTFCVGMFFVVYGALHGFNSNMPFYSVFVLNAASLFGRIVRGFLADNWGRFNMMVATALACAILTFASIAARNEASLLVIGVLYGFTSGNVASLQGACVPQFMDDPTKIGVAVGQLLSVSAFAGLTGPPIAGALITNHGFWAAQVFAGLMLLTGSILIFVARQSLSTRWII